MVLIRTAVAPLTESLSLPSSLSLGSVVVITVEADEMERTGEPTNGEKHLRRRDAQLHRNGLTTEARMTGAVR